MSLAVGFALAGMLSSVAAIVRTRLLLFLSFPLIRYPNILV
jgi:hypothetical protein